MVSGYDWVWVGVTAWLLVGTLGALAQWSEERRKSIEPDVWDYQDFIDKKGEWAEPPPYAPNLDLISHLGARQLCRPQLGNLIVARTPVRKPDGRVGILRAEGPNSLVQVQNSAPPYHEWIDYNQLEPLDPEYAQCLQDAWAEVDELTQAFEVPIASGRGGTDESIGKVGGYG